MTQPTKDKREPLLNHPWMLSLTNDRVIDGSSILAIDAVADEAADNVDDEDYPEVNLFDVFEPD